MVVNLVDLVDLFSTQGEKVPIRNQMRARQFIEVRPNRSTQIHQIHLVTVVVTTTWNTTWSKFTVLAAAVEPP